MLGTPDGAKWGEMRGDESSVERVESCLTLAPSIDAVKKNWTSLAQARYAWEREKVKR